ncbi:MAG: glutamine--fructose-6-phosphate transaminase (isomerizing) [Planctomycetota bacterium]|nr:MAG: glutamine--fructose-6-phosphate transaminase (isomerizing) [Planctomycetota bacterium]
MCGIIGYVGARKVLPILLGGLERLEYRGYDSAGVCVLQNGKIVWEKSPLSMTSGEKVKHFASTLNAKKFDGTTGIGHTRWATHGEPNRTNAHPHFSSDGKFALIHNGIIENYQELKKWLKKRGFRFRTDTDTEVLIHLIHKLYRGDLAKAVAGAMKRVEGSYAIGVISTHEPGRIVAARLMSPLIIGLGKGENFIASDSPAIIKFTRKVHYLEDGDFASLTADKISITRQGGKRVRRKTHTLTYDIAEAEKGGYPHFMLKEIYQQPEAIADTLAGRIKKNFAGVTFGRLGITDAWLKKCKKVVFVACGTAYHAGCVGRYFLRDVIGLDAQVEFASEFRYFPPELDKNSLVVAVSQSGETIDTLVAVREAKKLGAKVLAVCNVQASTITRESDATIYTHAGPEIGVASTKAYATQLAAIYLLGISLGELKGKIKPAARKRWLRELSEIPRLAQRTLEKTKLIKQCAQKYRDCTTFLYLGRGYNFATAYEGALKLKEISYIHAEGYGAGEMKHGPIALVQWTYPTMAVAPRGKMYPKMVSNIEEIKARNGIVLCVASENDRAIKALVDHVLPIPEVSEELSPLLAVIPLQLFAYHVAVVRGCSVDQPRNLAKSVTVE